VFHFVANLKPYLLRPGSGLRMSQVYLCSADYASESRELLAEARRRKRLLVADNGNFDLIGDLIEQFTPRAQELHAARLQEQGSLGRQDTRPREISRPLRDRYRALATDIERAGRALTPVAHVRAALAAQGEIPAAYLVGMEDLTMAALAGLGIMREYLDHPLSWFARLSRRAVAFAEQTRAGRFGPSSGEVFAGLHGLDFDTAAQAGKLAAEAGLEGIACGLGGAMSDRGFVGFRVQDGEVHDLPGRVPRPYLRVLEVAAGLHLGYAQASGRRPRFHALGIGTPILIPLLALLGDSSTYTATDSTAPIIDAYSSLTVSLYIERPAAMKLKAHRIAQIHLEGGPGWECTCPACRRFNAQHPLRWDEARRWWEGEQMRDIGPSDLRYPSPLADFLPFLSSPTDPETRRAAGLARIAHNHWVLRRLESAAQRSAREPEALRAWALGEVERYVSSSADPGWREATLIAWQIGDFAAARLADADPGGELVPG
jgi:hypothetical protein